MRIFFFLCCQSCLLTFSSSLPAADKIAGEETITATRVVAVEASKAVTTTEYYDTTDRPQVTAAAAVQVGKSLEEELESLGIEISSRDLRNLLTKYLGLINKICLGRPPARCNCAYGIRDAISKPFATKDFLECRPGVCICEYAGGSVTEILAPGLDYGEINNDYPQRDKFQTIYRPCEGFGNCECQKEEKEEEIQVSLLSLIHI